MGCAAGVCPRTRRWMSSRCCAGVPCFFGGRSSPSSGGTNGARGGGGSAKVEDSTTAATRVAVDVPEERKCNDGVSPTMPQNGGLREAGKATPGDEPQVWTASSPFKNMTQDLLVTSFTSSLTQRSARQEIDQGSDCDTDPDMPELVPADPPSPHGSHASQATLMGTPECEVESLGLKDSWRERRGGLDSCWGSNALKNALTTMGDEEEAGPAGLANLTDETLTPSPVKHGSES